MRQSFIDCPVDRTLQVVGGRWKPLILWYLFQQPQRFSALRRAMPNTTQKVLTQQLRELEQDGIVHREIYPQVPPKVEYSLTEQGRSLQPVIEAMVVWGRQRQSKAQEHVCS
ncbi:MAG TPA: helix-turn-helix domain-containing protein [Ktedonobacteraceae bacterium]|nr:helix-turn-helix domain-containing protein [Ktedonobacteraceae bacterium]